MEEVNMDKEKLKAKFDETYDKVDEWVKVNATEHRFEKWQVWLGIVIALLAIIGIAFVLGFI